MGVIFLKYSTMSVSEEYFRGYIMYNNTLNFNLYKIFYDVAQAGSLSSASKNLNISQPAISRSIKKLEDDLSVTLFYRTLNGMVLTEKGKELYGYVNDACNSLLIAEKNIMEDSNLEKGRINIGLSDKVSILSIIKGLNEFKNKYPKIEISIVNSDSTNLEKLLDNHEIDMIIDTNSNNNEEITNHLLVTNKYAFISMTDKYNNIKSLKELVDIPVVLPNDNKELNKVLNKNNLQFNNVIYTDSIENMKKILDSSEYIGYVSLYSIFTTNSNIFDIEEELPTCNV